MERTLRFFATTAAIVITATVTAASAADLPTRPYEPGPVVPALYNWTGMYVGINGGYGWGNQDPLSLLSNRFDRTSFEISGGMVGGTFGAQIQQGYVVLGVEGDLDWTGLKGNGISTTTVAGNPGGVVLSLASTISALGTARVRAGAALSNWLFYGTGGVAFANTSANGSSVGGAACGTLGVIPNCSASTWRPGITAGLGFEWGFAQNWSAKAEYLYIKTVGTAASTDSLNTVRGGINYRF